MRSLTIWRYFSIKLFANDSLKIIDRSWTNHSKTTTWLISIRERPTIISSIFFFNLLSWWTNESVGESFFVKIIQLFANDSVWFAYKIILERLAWNFLKKIVPLLFTSELFLKTLLKNDSFANCFIRSIFHCWARSRLREGGVISGQKIAWIF